MKVWVLTCDYSYETRNIAGVYATETLAKGALERHRAESPKCWADDHTVEEHEVEGATVPCRQCGRQLPDNGLPPFCDQACHDVWQCGQQTKERPL